MSLEETLQQNVLDLRKSVIQALADRNARIAELQADVTRLQKLLEVQAKVNRELSEKVAELEKDKARLQQSYSSIYRESRGNAIDQGESP